MQTTLLSAIRRLVAASLLLGSSLQAQEAPWRSLPVLEPAGVKAHTGSFVVTDREDQNWIRPPVVYREGVCTGRKHAKVVVVIFDPLLPGLGGIRLTEHVGANDPKLYSRILVDVIREASWGYVDYEIVDWIVVEDWPIKVDGFRYDEESFLEVRRTQEWQPATISYRAVFEENGLLERCKREGITELWLWGAGGMHMDEFAFWIPNRYARYGPTDNPWLYRPYDIPPELERTTWVMGFNYEVGPDNMIHSYTHRVESMAALQFGDGIWEPDQRRDPWNVFTYLEKDHPGQPSVVANCHFPPNAENGYDYGNRREVMTWAWHWHRYPDVRGEPWPIDSQAWGGNQFGFQKWILEHVPKFAGTTESGYNNWWVYVANTDEDLPDRNAPDPMRWRPPADLPPVKADDGQREPDAPRP